MALSLALEAHQVEASRIEVGSSVIDKVRDQLHPKQREAFDCPAPAINVLGGRQGGKTFWDVGWQIVGGLEVPGSVNPYFGLTGTSVGDIMWPEVQRWWQLLGWPASSLHDHNKTAVLPNGSIVKGRGTDDSRTIESARGAKYNRIVIDEMGAQPERFIRYFVDLLWPTMIKNRGRMVRSGNPGLVLSGYWFEQTNDNRTVTAPLFHWTAWDNPALGTAEEIDAFVSQQMMDSCGWSLERVRQEIANGAKEGPAITFQREWLAKWIVDVGALVFPWLPHRNAIKSLPTHDSFGRKLPEQLWRRALAADVGYVDSSAFATMAFHPMLPFDFILNVHKKPGMISPEFVAHMRELKAKVQPFRPPRVDTGGMGKAYAEHCIRAGVYVLAAEKTEKKANVRLFRDRVISGAVKYVEGECNDMLDECAALGWDGGKDGPKELPEEGKPDDATYATLYGWRDLWNTRESEDTPPDESAEAKARQLEQAMYAQRVREVEMDRRHQRRSER
jgi:hypothetical protein